MTINDFRAHPGLPAVLRQLIESEAFKTAVEAIRTSNKITQKRAIAENLGAPMEVESRLLNQQIGREDWMDDLVLCAVPIQAATEQHHADFGAEKAAEMLRSPEAPGEPWHIE